MKESTNIILKGIVIFLMVLFLFAYVAISWDFHKELAETKEARESWKTLFALILFLTPAPVVIIGGFVIWPKIKFYQREYDRQNKGKKGKNKKKKKKRKK